MTPDYLIDALLAVSLILLAMITLRQRTPGEAVVQLMIFGLLLSLSWLRIRAADLSLTEAAIGPGVTGALLLAALSRTGFDRPFPPPAKRLYRFTATLGCAFLGTLLSAAVLSGWEQPAGLTREAYAQLENSGSRNPVTAVILNYRGYDTLLEIGVLLVASLGVYTLASDARGQNVQKPGAIFRFYLRVMTPLFLLVVPYMVWVGGYAPGGAFQAGALLSGLGVLTLLGPTPWPLRLRRRLLRWGLVAGFLIFLAVGMWTWRYGQFLTYPARQAGMWILLIELTCTLSIGISLTIMFAGCAGWLRGEKENRS
jgi:multisubunit Na+/H+ antiporter MnhB subunit